MFHIISPNVLLNQIEQVFSNELADLLIMFPTLKENVTKNLLWGIFSNHSIYSKTEHFQQDENYVFSFDYSLIEQAKKELKNNSIIHLSFFSNEVDKFLQKNSFNAFFNRDCFSSKIDLIENPSFVINPNTPITLSLTLPDSHIVFHSFIKNDLFDKENLWLLPYMDEYEQIKHKIMSSLYSFTFQVGGHGRWTQDDYNNSYIAQLNFDIGDSGSIYIYTDSQSIKSQLDMF